MCGVDTSRALPDSNYDRLHYSSIMPVTVLTGYLLDTSQIRGIKLFDCALGKIGNNLKPGCRGANVVNAEVFDIIANLAFRDDERVSLLTLD